MRLWEFRLIDGRCVLVPSQSVLGWVLPPEGKKLHTVYLRWGAEQCEWEPGTIVGLFDQLGVATLEVEVEGGAKVGFPLTQFVGLELSGTGTRVFLGASAQLVLRTPEPATSVLARMEKAVAQLLLRRKLAQIEGPIPPQAGFG